MQWAQWMPSLKSLKIEEAALGDRPYSRVGSVAAFYPGGIDSLHTAIAHSPGADALVTIGHEPLNFGTIERRRKALEEVSDYAAKCQRHPAPTDR